MADLVSELMWGINVRDGSNMIPRLSGEGHPGCHQCQ